MFKYIILVTVLIIIKVKCLNYSELNLPREHLSYYLSGNKECADDEECKEHVRAAKCWGYEHGCNWDKQYSKLKCPGDHKGWVKSKRDQERTFFTQADFGYLKQQLNEMKVLCEPMFPDDSSLECSDHLRFCRGRNIFINFTSLLNRDEPIRYKMDVLKTGDIGGYCNFYQDRLHTQTDHLSPLQSWAPELRFFTKTKEKFIADGKCDIVVEKPTFIMKIDATVNMYHHFCDFLNLYASQHLNSEISGAFSTDVHILIWESFNYQSAFQSTFEAFTRHPIWDLKTFRGKTVCFKRVVFPLLPRMIFGLYYNTPVVHGCDSSGLFHAFSKHILHRLKIPTLSNRGRKVRITFLSRDTKHRRILNEDELITALKEDERYTVQKVVFNRDVTFKKQLEITSNTDVLIGIHGAGLTHLLFMPDWGAIFELYNCEDANCYMDLARLRGLKYVTWQDKDKLFQEDEGLLEDGGAHAKFTNYAFDVNEFLKLLESATNHVIEHPKYLEQDNNEIFENVLDDKILENRNLGNKSFKNEFLEDTILKVKSANYHDEL